MDGLSTPTGPRPPLLDGHLDRLFWTVILTASFGRSSRPPLLDGHLDRLFWTVISTASFGRSSRPPLLDGHLDRLCSAVVSPISGVRPPHGSPLRRVEPWSLTHHRVHRVQRRAFQITRHPHLWAGAPRHPTLEGYRRTISVHVRPCNLQDRLGPSGHVTNFVTHPRFIVASSSSGTQPTVLVCWATPDRRPCRRRHRRPRGRSSSMMLAISRARRRPEPRAEQARLLRASLPPQ